MADRAPDSDAPVLVWEEERVAWITLNRPERLNAFAGRMRDHLAAALEWAGGQASVRVIVVTGAGRGFCAGADVEVMAELVERRDAETFAGLVRAGMRVVHAIRSAPQPVVAALNGVAAGAGASLALACDLRIAAESASLGFTFNRIGLHPDWGATFFLPRLVGAGRAAELILTARMLEAAEAQRIGLVQEVVPDAELAGRVARLAGELARKPPLALARAKATLARAEHGALEEALQAEAEAQAACFLTRDVAEGIAAFREKRPPRFNGH